jgi:8-oxo-dGTP pyrophosphatase MutT (NUDIX family)
MEPLSVIRDEDIFDDVGKEPKFYTSRKTAKGIIFDDEGNIALLSVRGHVLFPGGGVKKRETLEQALIRECKEEIGCNIVPAFYIGRFDQYRAKTAKRYEVHFFAAFVLGEKGSPTTAQKDELDCTIIWEDKEKVTILLEEQFENKEDDDYSLQFNVRTHKEAYDAFLLAQREKNLFF